MGKDPKASHPAYSAVVHQRGHLQTMLRDESAAVSYSGMTFMTGKPALPWAPKPDSCTACLLMAMVLAGAGPTKTTFPLSVLSSICRVAPNGFTAGCGGGADRTPFQILLTSKVCALLT